MIVRCVGDELSPKDHTVYMLLDPRDYQIRYVGVTCRPLKTRLTWHMSECAQAFRMWKADGYEASGTPKQNWILDLRKSGLRPIIEPLESVEGWRADKLEKAWIRFFVHAGIQLTNSNIFVNTSWEHYRWCDEMAAQFADLHKERQGVVE